MIQTCGWYNVHISLHVSSTLFTTYAWHANQLAWTFLHLQGLRKTEQRSRDQVHFILSKESRPSLFLPPSWPFPVQNLRIFHHSRSRGSIFMCLSNQLIYTLDISNPKLVVIVGSLGLASDIVGLFLFHGNLIHSIFPTCRLELLSNLYLSSESEAKLLNPTTRRKKISRNLLQEPAEVVQRYD
jgi:hypothetical protein